MPVTIEAETTHSSFGADHDVAMPSSVPTGMILFVEISIYTPATQVVITPSGWTQIATLAAPATWSRLYLFGKVTNGSEGGTTVNFRTEHFVSNDTLMAARVRLFSGIVGNTLSSIETAGGVAGSTDSPNSGSITPSWGSDDTLFMSVLSIRDSAGHDIGGYPSGYSVYQRVVYYDSPTDTRAGVVSSVKGDDAGGTEDPPAYTLINSLGEPTSNDWAALTVAIRGSLLIETEPGQPTDPVFTSAVGGPFIVAQPRVIGY